MLKLTQWTDDAGAAVDAFVSEHPAGLIYYTSAFRRFLLKMLGCRCVSAVAWQGSDVIGVMPVMIMSGRWGTILNSLPFFGSNGGVLAGTEDAAHALLEEFDRLACASDVAAATWISNPFAPAQPLQHDLVDERIAQWTDLSDCDPETHLPREVQSSARRNVSKAVSEGIVVTSTPDGLDALERMHRNNMKAIGGREKPSAFFDAVRTELEFGRDWTLYLGSLDGQVVGGLLLFHAGSTVEYIMPGIDDAARNLQPTAVLIAKAMRDAASRGYRRWNWGGTWLSQDGVDRFKRKWGARETRYRYYVKLNNPKILDATAEELASAYPYFYSVPYDRLGLTAAKAGVQ